jgi:hypothetical protein
VLMLARWVLRDGMGLTAGTGRPALASGRPE